MDALRLVSEVRRLRAEVTELRRAKRTLDEFLLLDPPRSLQVLRDALARIKAEVDRG